MSGFNDFNSDGILLFGITLLVMSAFLAWQGRGSLCWESKSRPISRNRSNASLAVLQQPASERPTTWALLIESTTSNVFWDSSCYPGLTRRTSTWSFQEGKKDLVLCHFLHCCVMCRRQQSMSRNQLSWNFCEWGSHFQLRKGTDVSWMHYFWHLKMSGLIKVQEDLALLQLVWIL